VKEGGLNVPVMSGDGSFDPEWIKLAGTVAAEGDMASNVGLPIEQMPKGQDFMAAYNAMFPGEVPAAYDAYSYDAANVIIKAIIAVANDLGADKVTTTEGKKAIIAAVGKTDFEGVTGQVKFDAKGDTLNQTITVYVVKEGKWIPAPL
jgi:branched-chain amino acid transport system substrate-binding protein